MFTARTQLAHIMSYHDNGNIDFKSDAGTYAYASNQPHAVTEITDHVGNSFIHHPKQEITYNPFQKTATIDEDGNFYTITYGTDGQRKKTVLQDRNSTTETRIYSGRYEKTGNTELHYIPTPSGTVAVHIKVRGSSTTYFLLKDYLGSIMKVVNASGNTIEEHSYDAWGNHQKPTDWTLTAFTSSLGINRGYTGHEMLPLFQLINMNGRMYDPLIGQFLSPDPFVSDATNSQDFNRYTYARNNPLLYTDPEGEWIITAILIGVAVAAIIDYGVQVANNVAESKKEGVNYNTKDILWNKIDWFDVMVSGVGGGLSVAFPAAAPAIKYLSPVVKNAFDLYGDGTTVLVGRDRGVGDYLIRTGLDVATIAMTDVLKHGVGNNKSTPSKPLSDRWDNVSLKDIWKDTWKQNILWDIGASVTGTMAKNGWESQYKEWQQQQEQPPLHNPKIQLSPYPHKKTYDNSRDNTDDFIQLSKCLQLTR